MYMYMYICIYYRKAISSVDIKNLLKLKKY